MFDHCNKDFSTDESRRHFHMKTLHPDIDIFVDIFYVDNTKKLDRLIARKKTVSDITLSSFFGYAAIKDCR